MLFRPSQPFAPNNTAPARVPADALGTNTYQTPYNIPTGKGGLHPLPVPIMTPLIPAHPMNVFSFGDKSMNAPNHPSSFSHLFGG